MRKIILADGMMTKKVIDRKPTNCENEPPYQNHKTVCFSLRHPDIVAHKKSIECNIEYPHNVNNCGLFW